MLKEQVPFHDSVMGMTADLERERVPLFCCTVAKISCDHMTFDKSYHLFPYI